MLNNIKNITEKKMIKCINTLKSNIDKVHSGRANPKILDSLKIEYFGKKTPLKELATIIVEDHKTLKINLFDQSLIKVVEKEIINTNLNIYPRSVGCIIYISIPPMTEERRKKLIKIIKNESELSKISIRNIRKESNNKVKKLIKDKKISLDEEHRIENEIQKITDNYIKKIDQLSTLKSLELKKI